MVSYHNALGGAADVIEIAETPEEQAILATLLRELVRDTKGTLEVHKNKIKKLRGFGRRVFELRKPRDYRIFYVIEGEEMIILDIIKKKKNHTEGRYTRTLRKRLRTM
nr:hypothetical protein [Clostridium chromiireducens]